jgi:hypothetical protein
MNSGLSTSCLLASARRRLRIVVVVRSCEIFNRLTGVWGAGPRKTPRPARHAAGREKEDCEGVRPHTPSQMAYSRLTIIRLRSNEVRLSLPSAVITTSSRSAHRTHLRHTPGREGCPRRQRLRLPTTIYGGSWISGPAHARCGG